MAQISIVIPAKNEVHRLPQFLRILISFCQKSTHHYEIIIVDDGSRDSTASEAATFQKIFSSLQVISLDRNYGKGFAVKTGILAAQGEYVLFLDADGSTGPEEIERHFYLFDQGYDVIIGSRILEDEHSRVQALVYRRWIGAVFNFFVHRLLIKDIQDTQCGFKMFRANVGRSISEKLKLKGFGFDLEMLYLAQKMNCRIKEVPVNWKHVHGSKIHFIKDSVYMLLNIFQIRHWYRSR